MHSFPLSRLTHISMIGLSLALLPTLVSCGDSDKMPLQGEVIAGNIKAANILLNKAKSLEASGENKKAISTYKEIYKKYPNSTAAPEAVFGHARILDKQGDLIKAFNTYQLLIENYQASKRYSTALKRQETVAYAAANGIIKNNFLGLKTKIAPSRVEKMLGQVRDNAPQASSAPKAQFAIGRVWQRSGNDKKAIAAFRRISQDYPDSAPAPEALFQIGEILIQRTDKGNKNKANFDNATNIYNDIILRYPNHKRAADAKKRIKSLAGDEIQRDFNIAEFYLKKEQPESALFYYREVIRKTKSGSLHAKALQRINELKEK